MAITTEFLPQAEPVGTGISALPKEALEKNKRASFARGVGREAGEHNPGKSLKNEWKRVRGHGKYASFKEFVLAEAERGNADAQEWLKNKGGS
jgi:hypothetical protein